VNPDLVIVMNTASQPHVNRRIRELCDAGVWESQPHGGDYLGHSFASRIVRNDLLPAQVMTVRFYQGWGDLSLKPEAQLITECAAMVANGSPASVGDQVNVDGTLEPAVYAVLGAAFSRVRQWRRQLDGAHSVRHAMLMLPVPDETLSWLRALRPDDKDGAGITPWRGAHKMLVESHVQVDGIYSPLADDLSGFPVVILPEPSGYQPGMHQRLREYVEQGGTLVAVGASLLEQGRFGLEDVFGIRYVEPLPFSVAHFRPADELAHAVADIPHQVRGTTFKVMLDGAEPLASLIYPQTETQPPVRAFRSPYSPAASTPSAFPFATRHRFGAGQAVYIAASVFEIYWRTNHAWLRQFTEALLRHVDPAMPYELDGPSTVEVNLMRKDRTLFLNLVRYAPGQQGGPTAIAVIERPDPAHDIRCRVRCEGVRRVQVEGVELPFEQEGGFCVFTVPKVEYLTIVQIDQ
jgi:hypothetical protein